MLYGRLTFILKEKIPIQHIMPIVPRAHPGPKRAWPEERKHGRPHICMYTWPYNDIQERLQICMSARKRVCTTACKHASAAARKHARTTARNHARFSVVLRELSLNGRRCFQVNLLTVIDTFINTRVWAVHYDWLDFYSNKEETRLTKSAKMLQQIIIVQKPQIGKNNCKQTKVAFY